jgi:hypothetical protein
MLLFENIQINDLRKEGHASDLNRPICELLLTFNTHFSATPTWK